MSKFNVYYEDTDASGRVYHANYLKFLERSRTDLIYQTNYTHEELLKKFDLIFVVKECSISFKKSAFFEDLIKVKQFELAQKVIKDILESNFNEKNIETKVGGEKQKLIPTNIGEIVNSFMIKHFVSIIDYKYTSIIESELDKISSGELCWHTFLKNIYKPSEAK